MTQGTGGIFDVHVGGTVVFRKFDTGRFPSEQEILDKVAAKLKKA
jgi:selT/selW/selH-like putative selenoprotein